MSLYNLINGVTNATFFVLPMLGKHPDEYPRFRDCFTNDPEHPEYDNHIHIYTRTGGGNRESYESENAALQAMAGFVCDFDDSFDSTFASWIFRVPEQWQDDYRKVITGNIKGLSRAYQDQLRRVYPRLNEKFDALFSNDRETP